MQRFDTDEPSIESPSGRIGLLIRLYRAAITTIESAAGEMRSDPSGNAAASSLIRARRIVLEIIDGVDLQQGAIPQEVNRLCLFVLDALASGDQIQLAGACRVLTTLKEGFEGIRAEVRRLEESGELPSHEPRSTVDTVV